MKPFGFPKRERLCSKREIDLLFAEGRSVRSGMISIKYLIKDKPPGNPLARILVIVPKRLIRLAVTRNLVKRRIREVYRLNKIVIAEALPSSNKELIFAVIYNAKAPVEFGEIKEHYLKAMKIILGREEINKN